MRSAAGCAGLGARCCCSSPGTVRRRAAATSPARRCVLLGVGAAAWIGARRARGARCERDDRPSQRRRGASRCTVEIDACAGRCRCRRAGSTSRCCPSRVPLQPAGRAPRVRVEVTLRPPRAAGARAAGARPARPARAGRARRCAARHADELLVLPRTSPVVATGGGGDGDGRARARGADRRRGDRDRRPAPGREGSPAVAHPLAGARPRRRADGAQADLRGRLAAAGRPRPARADRRGGARRRRARRRVADAALRAPPGLRAAAAGRPPARASSSPTCSAWPQAHVRLALVGDHTGPSLVAAQNRRGLVMLVAARPLDRPPRGLGRTPGGCLLIVPGRAARPPRRRSRSRAASATSPPGRAAAAAARAPRDRSRADGRARRTGPDAPAAGRARDRVLRCSRASPCCTGWRCSRPASPGARGARAADRAGGRRPRCGARGGCRAAGRTSPASASRVVALVLAMLAGGIPRGCCTRRTGTSSPRASRAASRRCRACACPTAGWTRGSSSSSRSAGRRWSSSPRSPRSGRGAAGSSACPGSRCSLLVVLYAVPTVTLGFAGEFLRGAVLAHARARLPAARAAAGARRAARRRGGGRGRGRPGC